MHFALCTVSLPEHSQFLLNEFFNIERDTFSASFSDVFGVDVEDAKLYYLFDFKIAKPFSADFR